MEKLEERVGEENYNKDGYVMKVIKYISSNNVIVEFNDIDNTTTTTSWYRFKNGNVKNPNHIKNSRLGEIRINRFGSLMKCVEYNGAQSIVVEFQDEYKAKVPTAWHVFDKGSVRNPYDKSFYGVGIVGEKYPITINGKQTKEIMAWQHLLERCFSERCKEINPTYKNVTMCNEWLYYPNFYEWLHSQDNFEKWIVSNNWAIEKDIICKNNKIYAPDKCCLVPQYVNNLFCKHDISRGDLPVGVSYEKRTQMYIARVSKTQKSKRKYILQIGRYPTPEDAFYLGYKPYKEAYIQKVAQEEFGKGNITKHCYDAMMNYQVEITD